MSGFLSFLPFLSSDDHYTDMDVRQRLMDLGDRSISIENISSISITRHSLLMYFIVLLLPGLWLFGAGILQLVSYLSINSRFGGSSFLSIAIVQLLLAGGLCFLFYFFVKRRKKYLIIYSNDGRQSIFYNRDINLLRQVKAGLDAKIDQGNVASTFHVNFAKGSIHNLNVDEMNTDHIAADTVLSHSPGSVVASHSPGAQLGTGNIIKKADMGEAVTSLKKKSGDWLAEASAKAGFKSKAGEREMPKPLAEDFRAGPFGKQGLVDHNVPPSPASHYGRSHPHGEKGTVGLQERGVNVLNSPGAQVGDFNHLSDTQILTDYSAHIQRVETVKEGLNDPALEAKLDEMLTLMKQGTVHHNEKQKLKDYALEMATFVQAYPPISKIFHDIIRVIGI